MKTTFQEFLVEAKFSEEDLTRILNVFERKMPGLLGSKLYRYGGSNHVEKSGSERRIVWIFDKDRAFGVRTRANRVLGFDVWDKFVLNTMPTHFIDVSALTADSILGAIKQLAGLIKKPVTGAYPITVKEDIVTEARRVSDDAFYKMVVDEYGETKAASLSFDLIKAVATKNDVLIPAYVRGQKVGRGLFSAVPGADTSEAPKKAEKKPEKKQDILYIKVTAQDPDTKKFKAAGESAQAQALYQQIQDSLQNDKPTEKEMRDPETLYGHLSQLVEMACKGTLKSLLIYGGPGTGKTYTIMETIKRLGMKAGTDYVKVSGKASPLSMYQTLFMYRDGGLVLFDDCDSMWGNSDATNILKAALDTSPVREISWGSTNTINVSKMGDDERKVLFAEIDEKILTNPEKVKFPNQFDFTGRVVFISNLRKDEFDSAILSRSAKICMDLTPQEVLARMKTLLPTLGGTDVDMKKKEELLEALLSMHKRREIEAVTMREFIKGLNIVRSGAPNWADLLIYA